MKWFVFLFFALIISCSENVDKPENLINESQMVEVLTEIYIHQSGSYVNQMPEQPIDFARLNSYILTERNIKVEDFEKSYRYYVLNPDLYEPMLKEVRNNLENRLPEEERLKRQKERQENTKTKQ